MERITQILVPIDFSNCSENALAFAMQLADKIKAKLLLLNVPHIDSSNLENPMIASLLVKKENERSRKRLIESIRKVAERIGASHNEDPSIQTIIEIGKVEATICDVAERYQVDYIVMGTQGENSRLDKYLGSVASNVLKNAPCSVIVIPENTVFAKNVVLGYATDFSDADPFEIWRVIKLFKPFQPKIKCVHFYDKQVNNEDKIEEMKSYFAETAPELKIDFFSLAAKDKVKDLNDFIDNENVNMLIMYKPKRAFFESIFHSSYTQKMARQTNIPLLVIKQSE